MHKTFVLDTNVLLTNPTSIFKFDTHDVVIPISVIEELDTFKKDMSEIGRHAREFSRMLDQLRSQGKLCSGVKLCDRADSGMLYVHLSTEPLPEALANTVDNHILAIAASLQRQGKETIVVTKDANLRIKADACNINAEDYTCDKIDVSHLFTGVRQIDVSESDLNQFFSKQSLSIDGLAPNEFVSINSPTSQAYGRYDPKKQRVCLLTDINDVWGIKPRNAEQTMALSALLDDKIKLVTLCGSAGTGKTLMAIAAGLHKTTDDTVYKKLLVARPIFPLGRDIGFLPGDLSEKLNPWMQPIFDNLELLLGPKHGYQELINQGLLGVEPLTYIRGRSLPNIFFIVDEAQNLTPHEVKTILTRAGNNTKIILTGDPDQIDNPYVDSANNGLTYVIEKFKNEPLAAHVELVKGERSELATVAAKIL